jgi:hypothetical protein
MLQLAVAGGFVGEITADSFMKREFGKALIQNVLPRMDLVKVISTSGAYIPGHGTPTVILFARNRSASSDVVRVVMGKRGEPGKPDDPAQGKVWSSIVSGHEKDGYENEYISVSDRSRTLMSAHPWSIGGGGADLMKRAIEEHSTSSLGQATTAIGYDTITRAKDLLEMLPSEYQRHHVTQTALMPHPDGEAIGDWSLAVSTVIPVPYDRSNWTLVDIETFSGLKEFLWAHRTWLRERWVSGGTRMSDVGLPHWAIPQLPRDKHKVSLSIVFGEVSTHNRFTPPYSRPQRIARRAGRFSRENLAIRTEERAA